MYYAAVINRTRLVVAGLLCLGLVNAGMAVSAFAADTTVSTKICNADAPSTANVYISSPQNDSVMTTGNLTLSGTVQDVSQIDISIDANYSQTVAIATGQTTFSVALSVPQGTHTISVEGIDICNIADPTDSVVVTFQPGTSPSNGGSVPTNTGTSNKPSGGVGKPGGAPVETDWTDNVPLVPQAMAILRETGRTLDFDQSSKDGLLKAVTRFAFFTLGAGLLLFGPILLARFRRRMRNNEAVAQYVQGESGKEAGVTHRHTGGIVRSSGIGLILLTFLI